MFNAFRLIIISILFVFSFQAFGQEPKITIQTYVASLRDQFAEMKNARKEGDIPIWISPIEVELSTVTKLEGDGKVSFWVVEIGGKYSDATTQKLKFTISANKPGEHFEASAPDMDKNFPFFNDLSKSMRLRYLPRNDSKSLKCYIGCEIEFLDCLAVNGESVINITQCGNTGGKCASSCLVNRGISE